MHKLTYFSVLKCLGSSALLSKSIAHHERNVIVQSQQRYSSEIYYVVQYMQKKKQMESTNLHCTEMFVLFQH